MDILQAYKNFRIGSLSALVLAGGSGTRMGSEIPKQHLPILGVPVIVRTLLAFEHTPAVTEIIVAIRPGEEELYQEYKEKYQITKLQKTVVGGATRTESAFHAMEAVSQKADLIAIHDGARCLVTREMIEAVAFSAVRHKAATAACPVTDTIAVVSSDGKTKPNGQPERSTLMALQTPQIFNADLYRAISYSAKRDGFMATDDTSLAGHYGFACQTVNTGVNNIKITTKEDLLRAEIIIASEVEE